MNSRVDPIINSFNNLKLYCEAGDFKGWDPFDGLNSGVFQATPLKHWRLARQAWVQLFKLNPVNLRKLLLIPREHNSKGIGLFLTGYCNLYKMTETGDYTFGTKEELLSIISRLAGLLISLQSKGYSGACWGYNFDWQNRSFFQPKNTPTIVATSFCADALFNAYEITGNKEYLETALSSANFVMNDLNRTKCGENFLFSYSPLDHSQVYNASLLGARLLARCYSYSKNEKHLSLASKVVNECMKVQSADGYWVYGAAPNQQWIDSFHTGFNLECIWEYMQYTGDNSATDSFRKGMKFYMENFFRDDGISKYYHNKIYPVDIHSPAQLVVTLTKSKLLEPHIALVEKVLIWTINNMQNRKGFFYYQIKKGISSKIPYMRWAQAWMFYALSYYLKKQ
jgi:rhamnogalacturonyl hydrolase YesR